MRFLATISVCFLMLSSCSSVEKSQVDPVRKVKVCVYNGLVRWMNSGSTSASVSGDAKRVINSVGTYKILEGVCDETEKTINEDF